MSVFTGRGIWAFLSVFFGIILLLITFLFFFLIPPSDYIDPIVTSFLFYIGISLLIIGIAFSSSARRDIADLRSILHVAAIGTSVTITEIRQATGLDEDRIRSVLEDLLKKKLVYGHFEGDLFFRHEGRQDKTAPGY